MSLLQMSFPALLCVAAFIALLAGAAIQDVRSHTISNGWPLALMLLFAVACYLGVVGEHLGSHALHFAVALPIGFALFAVGWFGGGDVKLYAAVALWFTLGNALYLLLWVALAGVVLAIAHIAFRMFRSRGDDNRRSLRESELAYGVAIAVGAVIALPNSLH